MSLPRWARLEEWIYTNQIRSFRHADLMAHAGIENWEATGWIQDYQRVQASTGRTLYLIHRQGRTTAAEWFVTGVKDPHAPTDARSVATQFSDDVGHRTKTALRPILNAIADRNPAVRTRVNDTMYEIGRLVELLARI